MKTGSLLFLVALIMTGGLAACAAQPTPTASLEAVPTSVWSTLLDVTPMPYAGPLPGSQVTGLDGTYAWFDPAPPQWWSCLRCADYRPAGGAWRLQFERGVMRIYYEVTGWHSLASYTVAGNRLFLFNDPYCKDATGEYQWELEDGILTLTVVNDPCSFQLRGKNLSAGEWATCPPGGSTKEGQRGCTDPLMEPTPVPALADGLKVAVIQADVRLTDQKPAQMVNGSGTDRELPAGVQLVYSDSSLLYGISRVLWTDDDWVEITTQESFTAMGVQFRGDYVIGWARVLFDGQEIWRGDTSRVWSELKVHGGYIEITGFSPGEHKLRVERLDVDSRPVVVAYFGFDR